MKRVLLAVGTRPEAIKIAPIVLAMRRRLNDLEAVVCLTGQHPCIAQEALDVFGITADVRLDCVPPGGDLCLTAAGVIQAVGRLIDERPPDVVLVQGDTLSALAVGLAAALRRCPVAHVEAGLRSGTSDDPFPEEISRRQLSHLADWHFAPTQSAVDNLLAEGIDPSRIHCVGNTVIDALRIVRSTLPPAPHGDGRTVLVTVHRRENWGCRLHNICAAVLELARRHKDWRFVLSVHPNPDVRSVLRGHFVGHPRIQLLDAPRYDQWIAQVVGCDLILTDSGGMQEEGCALGRPVLVLRDVTERPEAVECGAAVLVGARTADIIRHTERVMLEPALYAAMARPRDVFGDGLAAQRIADILAALQPLDDLADSWYRRNAGAVSLRPKTGVISNGQAIQTPSSR